MAGFEETELTLKDFFKIETVKFISRSVPNHNHSATDKSKIGIKSTIILRWIMYCI